MSSGLNYKKLLGAGTLLAVIIFNLYLTSKPQLYTHLQTDIVTYYYRSHYLIDNGSLEGLEGNEYQPGAMLFFVLLSPFLQINDDFAFFKESVFVINIVFALLLSYLYKKYSGEKSIYIYSLILLFTGPIFLFRFDLYVMVLIIASFYFWQKKYENLSLFFLGWATLTKIFPVIFLPYYLILNYTSHHKKRGLNTSLKIVGKYLLYTMALLLVYMRLFRVNFLALASSWNFLAHVPVNTESVWGSLLSLYSIIFRGRMAHGLGNWGTFGISPGDTVGPLWLYSSISFIAVTAFYLWLFIKKRNYTSPYKFDIKVPLAVILTFLVFSRVIHHQYTLWYMLLLPLLSSSLLLKDTRWRLNLILALIASLIFIYIYPLHFSEVVYGVYKFGKPMYLFWLNFSRNIVLIILWLRVISEIIGRRYKLPRANSPRYSRSAG